MPSDDLQRVTLRIPVELQVELKVQAARARRSFNSHMISILEGAVRAAAQNEKTETTA